MSYFQKGTAHYLKLLPPTLLQLLLALFTDEEVKLNNYTKNEKLYKLEPWSSFLLWESFLVIYSLKAIFHISS